ncbi:kinase-like domain-containing protein [Xylaria digitata]|nr:kinase-like domain-containing protein [Xylaria digitata]
MADSRRSHAAINSLRQRLYTSQVKTESGEHFIPDGVLEEIMDDESVYSALIALGWSGLIDAPTAYEQVRHSSLKIFAILVLTRSPDVIFQFIDIGINDSDLPYLPDTEDSRAEQGKWSRLKDLWSEPDLDLLFFKNQWSVLAPRFVRGVDASYNFTHHHILPFLPMNEEGSSSAVDERVKAGAFSEVRKVKIHPSHHDFGHIITGDSTDIFALKRLYTHEQQSFESELSALRHLQKFQHPHLIQLLTSFRVQGYNGDSSRAESCLIFPWATGNLRDFWIANEKYVGDKQTIPWISKQCYGLAAALELVHDGRHPTTTSEEPGMFRIHGDIKPSNILWYTSPDDREEAGPGSLVLADFGLSVPVRRMSWSNVSASGLMVSPTYRAPEVDVSKTVSRKMDIWMLGCTYLELLTWFLRGSEAAAVDFPNFRSEHDGYGIHSDTFFRVSVKGSVSSAQTKPQIADWIRQLSSTPHCSRYLQEFLVLIETRMLTVNPQDRITASELKLTLKEMDRRFMKSDEKSRSEIRPGVGSKIKAFWAFPLRRKITSKPRDSRNAPEPAQPATITIPPNRQQP